MLKKEEEKSQVSQTQLMDASILFAHVPWAIWLHTFHVEYILIILHAIYFIGKLGVGHLSVWCTTSPAPANHYWQNSDQKLKINGTLQNKILDSSTRFISHSICAAAECCMLDKTFFHLPVLSATCWAKHVLRNVFCPTGNMIWNINWFCRMPVHTCVAECVWNGGYICHWGHLFWGCTFNGVYVPCIYPHARQSYCG